MTKEKLERIKQAYYSGLKVQIWFDGYWENFDARDYSMYPDPFSEHRQYRIVGSDYADIAEKHIAELKKENAKLQAKIDDWQSEYIELENLKNSQLTQAKKIIGNLYAICKDNHYPNSSVLMEQAEQFLKECE